MEFWFQQMASLKTSNHLPAQNPEEYQALDSNKVNTHSGL